MGKEDGVPKTPEWASKKCGVPEWTIKALARDWAKRSVSIAHYFGGSYDPRAYSHEPARLEVYLTGYAGTGRTGCPPEPDDLWRYAPQLKASRPPNFYNPVAQ